MKCRVCGLEFTGNYCPNCGAPVQAYESYVDPAQEGLRSIGSLIWLVSVFSFIVLLLVLTSLHIIGASIIPSGILESGSQVHFFIIIPIPVSFASVGGYWFVGWYFFIFTAILLSFIWLLYTSLGPTFDAIKKPFKDFRGKLTSSSTISMIAQLFLALLFFNFVYSLILYAADVTPNVPQPGGGAQWEMLFLLANASVYEEIVTRILFIGFPLFLVHFASGIPMEKKKTHRYILGGGFGLNRTTIFLLLFSSSMFAAAHFASWDLYKMPTTFLAGLALGYLYLRKGIFASILLHFSFNYFSALLTLIQGNLETEIFMGMLILALSALGAFFFLFYILRIYGFFFPKPQVQEPIVQEKKLHFMCPYCGGLEARYSEGKFECLNCGFRF